MRSPRENPAGSKSLATRLHAVTAQIRDIAGAAGGERWHLWLGMHGDPRVVSDLNRPAFSMIATASTEPDDYGHGLATFIASMSPDIAILIADVIDAVADEHVAIHWPHDDDHEYVCARCGLDSPCPDLTTWLPLVEAFEARR